MKTSAFTARSSPARRSSAPGGSAAWTRRTPDNAKFCSQCGSPLAKSDAVPPQDVFVRTRGGEYLFVPGMTALAALADGTAG